MSDGEWVLGEYPHETRVRDARSTSDLARVAEGVYGAKVTGEW